MRRLAGGELREKSVIYSREEHADEKAAAKRKRAGRALNGSALTILGHAALNATAAILKAQRTTPPVSRKSRI